MKEKGLVDGGREAKAAPIQLKRNGMFGRITTTVKRGVEMFIVDYRVNGERKQVWRNSLEKARQAFCDAADKIASGQSNAAELTNADAFMLMRATEALAGTGKPIDEACRELAAVLAILSNRITPLEAAREWLNRNGEVVEKIRVRAAMDRMLAEFESQGLSSQERIHFRCAIRGFADYLDSKPTSFNSEVHAITPDMVNLHLAGLPLAKRTKANRRDRISAFNRWLVLKQLLPKGTDWMEHVKTYSRSKEGEVEVFTPDEMSKLLAVAGEMTLFLALAAFAGIRHLTIIRMDWSEIDLDNPYKVKDEVWTGCIKVPGRKGKNKTRYLIPVHDNLKAWLLPLQKKSGKLFPQLEKYKRPQDYTNQKLAEIAKKSGIAWRHNALRHSYVSYRLAECHDIMRVARESNNSPAIIETNYEQTVLPAAAAEWFKIITSQLRLDGQPSNGAVDNHVVS